MNEKKQPYMKWYPRDWRGDGALRMCSFAARGLWADLLSLMHDEGEPYGHLRMNGKAPTSAQLSRMLGGTPREIDRIIAELEEAGVFSRDDDGIIFSRRMVRDKAKADLDKQNGGKGGNPDLKPKPNGPDNGGVNPQDKAHYQKPETITQKPEEKEGRARASRLPPDWTLPSDWKAEAVAKRDEHGMPPANLDLEAEKFANYWHGIAGQRGTKLDWRGTWINWTLRADAPRPNGVVPHERDHDEITNPFAVARARRLAGEPAG